MLLSLPVIKTLDKDIGYLKKLYIALNSQAVNGIHIFLISLKIIILITFFLNHVFLKKMGGDLISCIIGVYVDNMLITGILHNPFPCKVFFIDKTTNFYLM